jgi:hypothetical protein
VTRINRVLICLHELYQLIVPLCVSKAEWEAWELRANDLNIVSASGLKPAFSSCQANMSSSRKGGSLVDAIGDLQGRWHVDFKDCPNGWTLVVGFIRIPPGVLLF